MVGKEKSGRTGLFCCITLLCAGRNIHQLFVVFFSVLPLPIISMWAFQFPVLFLKLLLFSVTHVPIFITVTEVHFSMGILGI